MTPHDHTTIVPGCYRCELGRDEAEGMLGVSTEAFMVAEALLREEGLHSHIALASDLPLDQAKSAIRELIEAVNAGPEAH